MTHTKEPSESRGGSVLRCYPMLDAYAFSCDLGVMKPEPTIYSWICDQLGASPTASWMIGDSQRCDRDGPTAVGIRGFFVDRNSTNGDCPELVTFARKVLATAP